jgi:hypothetical protein
LPKRIASIRFKHLMSKFLPHQGTSDRAPQFGRWLLAIQRALTCLTLSEDVVDLRNCQWLLADSRKDGFIDHRRSIARLVLSIHA